MAEMKDYLPGGNKNPLGGITDEIDDAEQQQTQRQRDPLTGQFITDATPNVDWEDRYKELERLNSRQAQDLGTYRRMVDDYITNPTPTEPVVEEELQPLTVDDLYDNPDEAVRKAVDSHPAIREAKALRADLQKRDLMASVDRFKVRHPDYEEICGGAKFRDWVDGDSMRQELFSRGNQYDLSAADALVSLYKAENGMTQMNTEREQQQQIDAATLEDSSAIMVQEPVKYSRSEYVQKLTRARQGDLEADDWVKRNSAGYREALTSGNVRD